MHGFKFLLTTWSVMLFELENFMNTITFFMFTVNGKTNIHGNCLLILLA